MKCPPDSVQTETFGVKERYQNPTNIDTIRLRSYTYNSNNLFDVTVSQVAIYYFDRNSIDELNPHGRILITTIPGDQVVRDDIGSYHIDVLLNVTQYPLGKYQDVWTFVPYPDTQSIKIEHDFKIYSQLFYSTPVPVVYDFGFSFSPNKIRQGSKQYLRIHIQPNVPRATDMGQYYTNLAIVSDLKISMALRCGACVPVEEELRLVIDQEPVDYRELCYGYYFLDTTDMELGIYELTFYLAIGGNIFVSDKQNLQVFN